MRGTSKWRERGYDAFRHLDRLVKIRIIFYFYFYSQFLGLNIEEKSLTQSILPNKPCTGKTCANVKFWRQGIKFGFWGFSDPLSSNMKLFFVSDERFGRYKHFNPVSIQNFGNFFQPYLINGWSNMKLNITSELRDLENPI